MITNKLLFNSGSGGGGIDVTELNVFQVMGTFTNTANNTYQDVVNITGKGYLAAALAIHNAIGDAGRIRITLDGSVIYASYVTGGSYPRGIVPVSMIHQYTSGSANMHTFALASMDNFNLSATVFATRLGLPHSTDTATGFTPIVEKLYFNTSLQIEIRISNTANTHQVFIEGAYV